MATSTSSAPAAEPTRTTSSDPPSATDPKSSTLPPSDEPPSAEALAAADTIPIFSAPGTSTPFRDIYAADDIDRHLVIFVRHFFCGICQDFLASFSHTIPPSSLPPRTRITIIGPGSPTLIPSYLSATSSPYTLLSEPTGQLYDVLGFIRTLSLGDKKPSYVKRSMLVGSLASIAQAFGTGREMLKGGEFDRNGGEILWVRKEDEWNVEWIHRMRNTRGHAEIDTLKQVLGVA
ncbi:hypothetical protein EJ06DRAFT_558664 [Trichodelitschia bisporula]|uniref:Thioredoxin-like protein n=1 Tax=Trichodelitschia bisporula TaxID=703511 RepID=A0A6G1HNM4_9PEZI|nr:hypothetical protein EJ06DRAFT_558664 [Trichodelitschia bisporula]